MTKNEGVALVCAGLLFTGCAATDFGANMATLAAAPVSSDAPTAIFIEQDASVGDAIDTQMDTNLGTKISAFKTDFKKATKSRAHNIAMASNAIDETVVAPGAVFSFNDAVGPTTKKNGFMLGRIFVNGKDGKGYGGGVCQVSSTLYNAVTAAGLDVTEHHNHSKDVNYVAKGKDAATSYGVLDFKFTNNKPYPVRINSFVMGEEENITVVLMAL